MITTQPQKDYSRVMKALVWHGSEDVRVMTQPRPLITDSKDALIRVSLTTICGSDLHLYHNSIPGMKEGDILGHECVGTVEDIGSEVENVKIGDRVVVSPVLACGTCDMCKEEKFSECEITNPSVEMEKMLMGQKTAGLLGFSHYSGGYPGCHAEYVRIPFADVNLLKIPLELSDEKAIFLSDVLPTAWQATEMAEVSEGKTVAVWGLGPIGLMTMEFAKHRGASRVIGIDCVPYRLEVAKNRGFEVINFKEEEPVGTLLKMIPHGPDCVIDCVGFRYAKSWRHTLEKALHLETDAIDSICEGIYAVKKCGVVSVIGEYFGYANHFPIGAVMEKGITFRSGIANIQKYWKQLLELLEKGSIDPTFLISHHMSLDRADDAYRIFDRKEHKALKIMLKPEHKV